MCPYILDGEGVELKNAIPLCKPEKLSIQARATGPIKRSCRLEACVSAIIVLMHGDDSDNHQSYLLEVLSQIMPPSTSILYDHHLYCTMPDWSVNQDIPWAAALAASIKASVTHLKEYGVQAWPGLVPVLMRVSGGYSVAKA